MSLTPDCEASSIKVNFVICYVCTCRPSCCTNRAKQHVWDMRWKMIKVLLNELKVNRGGSLQCTTRPTHHLLIVHKVCLWVIVYIRYRGIEIKLCCSIVCQLSLLHNNGDHNITGMPSFFSVLLSKLYCDSGKATTLGRIILVFNCLSTYHPNVWLLSTISGLYQSWLFTFCSKEQWTIHVYK